MTNAEKILCKQWQGGYELYGRDGFLSGEAAGRIVRAVLDLPCTFTDFDCKTPSDPLSFERFERIADRITSRAVGLTQFSKRYLIQLADSQTHYLSPPPNSPSHRSCRNSPR